MGCDLDFPLVPGGLLHAQWIIKWPFVLMAPNLVWEDSVVVVREAACGLAVSVYSPQCYGQGPGHSKWSLSTKVLLFVLNCLNVKVAAVSKITFVLLLMWQLGISLCHLFNSFSLSWETWT